MGIKERLKNILGLNTPPPPFGYIDIRHRQMLWGADDEDFDRVAAQVNYERKKEGKTGVLPKDLHEIQGNKDNFRVKSSQP